jgi:hypothetical protein
MFTNKENPFKLQAFRIMKIKSAVILLLKTAEIDRPYSVTEQTTNLLKND